MEDKNEKTFSDLFLNTKNETESNEDESAVDNFLTKVDDNLDENDSIQNKFSFSSFSDIVKNSVEFDSYLKDEVKSENIVNEDLNQVKSSSIFDVALENIDDSANKLENKEIEFKFDTLKDSVSDEVIKNDFFKEQKDDISVDNVDEIKNDDINNNVFFEIESSNNDSDDIIEKVDSEEIDKNDFVTNSVDKIDVEKDDMVSSGDENVEQLTVDIFGMGGDIQEDKNDTVILNDNFKDKEVSTNVFEDGNVNKIEEQSNISKESNSPFFENIDSSNPLFSNSISLEENNSIEKEIGKLNLSGTKHFNVKVVPKKESLTKFIFGVISYAFFIWLLLIGITLLVYVLDIKIKAAKGDTSSPVFNAYVVLTGSMLPDIQVNDVVITKKVDAEDLEVGDIITFVSDDSRFNNAIITHRIIKKNPANKASGITFQTKGDNNNVADSALVPEANVFGKVILKIPKLGYLQEFLASQGGWIIVILIPCLTVISYDVVKITKGIKKKKYKDVKVKK